MKANDIFLTFSDNEDIFFHAQASMKAGKSSMSAIRDESSSSVDRLDLEKIDRLQCSDISSENDTAFDLLREFHKHVSLLISSTVSQIGRAHV